ncbi:MAG: zinc ribbon domain-containing protein [Treponema sp.]|nr:zinc ribbon domain-containing protein [Treponema sp.]
MKKDNTKEAKFFCESCGSEVPRQAKFCPTCGKFFASVRCPRCGKVGTNDDFINGCPDCGYAVDKKAELTAAQQMANIKNAPIKDSFFFEYEDSKSPSNKTSFNRNSRKGKGDSQLPIWIPIVCILVLGALILGLYSCL